METKTWWVSKTLWVNIIAIAALIAQSQYGFVISGEEQVAILAVINIILRAITKTPISLRKSNEED